MDSAKNITLLLVDWRNGDQSAIDRLIPIVYDELRRLASFYMKRERPDHTLQTSALINEAFLRLVDQNITWQNRAHFFGVSARLMRQILVDHARARNYAKRGGDQNRVSLEDVANLAQSEDNEIVALDDALRKLAEIDPKKSQIIELRFFAGLTIEETGEVLGISRATADREWRVAKAWIYREIKGED